MNPANVRALHATTSSGHLALANEVLAVAYRCIEKQQFDAAAAFAAIATAHATIATATEVKRYPL